MSLKKLLGVSLLVLPAALLSGCNQETEQDLLSEAQYCLDGATTAAQAQSCLSSIDGINNKSANVLRCSAAYIGEGFGSPSKLIEAFDKIDQTPTGNATSTESFLAIMAFSDKDLADETFGYCQATGLKGLSLLSAMTKAATNLASLLPGGIDLTNPDQLAEDLHDKIESILDGSASQADIDAGTEAVGETVTAIYQVACQTGTPANGDLCTQMDDAFAAMPPGYTAADVGKKLMELWQTP
jgi:hypothetical protein